MSLFWGSWIFVRSQFSCLSTNPWIFVIGGTGDFHSITYFGDYLLTFLEILLAKQRLLPVFLAKTFRCAQYPAPKSRRFHTCLCPPKL